MFLFRALSRILVPALAVPITLALIPWALVPSSAASQQSPENASPWVAPERAARRKNPIPATPAAIKQGRQIFEQNCQICHGARGRGDGPQAKFIEPRPRNLTSAASASQSDGALFWKIGEGRGPMPKGSWLTDDQKWQVIDYLRTLARKP